MSIVHIGPNVESSTHNECATYGTKPQSEKSKKQVASLRPTIRKGPYPTRGVTKALESVASVTSVDPIRVDDAMFQPQWETPDLPDIRFAFVSLSSSMHPHAYLEATTRLASYQIRMHVASSIAVRLAASKKEDGGSGRTLHTASCMTKERAVNIEYMGEHILESELKDLENLGDRAIRRPEDNEYIIIAFKKGDGWYTCAGCSMFKVVNERLLRNGHMVLSPVVRCIIRTARRGLGVRLQALLEEVARNVGADLIRMESVNTKYATRPAACVVYSDNPNAQAPGLGPISTLNDVYQRIGFTNLHDACAAQVHDTTQVNPYAASAISMSKCLHPTAPAGPHLGPKLPNHPWALLDTLVWFYDMRIGVASNTCTLDLSPKEGVNAPMRSVMLTATWPEVEREPTGEGVEWTMQLEWVRTTGERHEYLPVKKDIGKTAVFNVETIKPVKYAFALQTKLLEWVHGMNDGEPSSRRHKKIYAHMLRYLLYAMRWHHAPVPETKPRTIIEPVPMQ